MAQVVKVQRASAGITQQCNNSSSVIKLKLIKAMLQVGSNDECCCCCCSSSSSSFTSFKHLSLNQVEGMQQQQLPLRVNTAHVHRKVTGCLYHSTNSANSAVQGLCRSAIRSKTITKSERKKGHKRSIFWSSAPLATLHFTSTFQSTNRRCHRSLGRIMRRERQCVDGYIKRFILIGCRTTSVMVNPAKVNSAERLC